MARVSTCLNFAGTTETALMGTDTPESMGFTVIHGNRMHINLTPHTTLHSTRTPRP